MMRWSVYTVIKHMPGSASHLARLGYVNAGNYGNALRRATDKWPKHIKPELTQAGFSVRPYKTDRLPLGKLYQPI